MDSQTSGTPGGDWIKDIAFAVRDLVRQYGVQRFRDMVERFVSDRNRAVLADRPDLPLRRLALPDDPIIDGDREPAPLTMAEKYAVLAATHDAICRHVEPIRPWPGPAQKTFQQVYDECEGDIEAAKKAFFGRVPKDFQDMVDAVQDERLLTSSHYSVDNLRRSLKDVLEDVRADLAKGTGPAASIEAAVAELLRCIPDTWQVFSLDDLTDMQSQGLRLLTAAGLVERRGGVRLRMLNHPVMVEATWMATGAGGLEQALEGLCAAMWIEWQDAYNKWKRSDTGSVVPFHSEPLGPSEWRLSADGVNARKDLAGDQQKQQGVFDWVLRQGIFDGQPRLLNGRIIQYGPVRGKGELLRMNKVTADALAAGTVNIGNWPEGASVFGETLAATFAAMQAKAEAPANPEPAKVRKPTDETGETPQPADWHNVQERLLRLYDAGEPFTSQRDLAERMKCSLSTVNKAIQHSAKLKGWQARYRKKAVPKAQSLDETVTDTTPNQREDDPTKNLSVDDVDRIMARLIEQAKPTERAKLNALDAEAREKMAKLYQEQIADQHIQDNANTNRMLGRKP